MNIVITGHTYGIGQALFKNFKQHNPLGLSRSNGYDIDKDFDKVVKAAQGCDLFINNAYRDQQQLKLVQALKKSVGRMIVMGSVSRFYPELIPTDYVKDKQALAEECRLISLDPLGIDILHLDLSFIESTDIDKKDPTAFTSDNFITYNEIVAAVNFWMHNPKVRQMEFVWKLTPFLKSELYRINPNLDPSRITL